MWIATTRGFYSIVQNYHNPTKLLVRARLKGDLERLKEIAPTLSKVEETRGRDYRWRAEIDRAGYALLLTRLASEIAYGNFKEEAGKKLSRRHHDGYAAIWTDMYLQQEAEKNDADKVETLAKRIVRDR